MNETELARIMVGREVLLRVDKKEAKVTNTVLKIR